MKLQHWEKEIELEGKKYRIKKLTPFEFPAFKIAFAKATNDNDTDALAKVYETIASWLQSEVVGAWVPIYDKAGGKFVIKDLNDDIAKVNTLLDLALSELIMPLFLNTTE